MQTSIYPKNQINVGKNERAASLFGGGALILMALLRTSRLKFPLALTGGYLLYRGASGNCLVYEAMGINWAGPGGEAGLQVERSLTIEKRRDEAYRFWRNFEVMETGETATVEGQTSGRIEQVEKEREDIRRRRKMDIVQEASEESFPASDAPAWTGGPVV